MLIKIHKIEKYKNYWKVRFTSERNPQGMEISTPVFDDYDKLIKHIESYIENNIPVVEEVNIEKDSDEIVIEEPKPEPTPEPKEPTPEELQLSDMRKELSELQQQKESLANEIKNLLEDWKLDLDLVKFKDDFNITDENFDAIIQSKLERKLPKYIKLKTQYEQLKQQIASKEEEIKQFAEENNLDAMI